MLALSLWLRRSTSTMAFPGLVVLVLVVIHSRGGWQYEWDWAFNNASTSAILLTPVAAGLVAFDRARRLAPTLADMAATTPRGLGSLAGLAVASWLWHVAAWALGMGYVAVRVSLNGAVGLPSIWNFLQAPMALLAGVGIGLMWGSLLPNLAAGPLAAISTYLAGLLGNTAVGLPGVLTAGGSTGTLVGLEQVPSMAISAIMLNLVLALVCGLVAAARTLGTRLGLRWLSVLAAIALAGCMVNLWSLSRDTDPYRTADAPIVCLGNDVTVCGRYKATPLLEIAHQSLKSALAALTDSDIDWQTKYLLPNDARDVPPDSGVLRLSPELISDDQMGLDDLAATLATPRMCRAFFADAPDGLLGEQSRVLQWVARHVRPNHVTGPAPREIQRAYGHLRDCTPVQAPTSS